MLDTHALQLLGMSQFSQNEAVGRLKERAATAAAAAKGKTN